MKKFLTVLLALSVVFTYSFSAVGTAFAATPSEATAAATAAKKEAAATAADALNTLAYANGSLAFIGDNQYAGAHVVSKTAVDQAAADLLTEINREIQKAADNSVTGSADVDTEIGKVKTAYYATTDAYLAKLFDKETDAYTFAKVYAKQAVIDKAAALAKLNAVVSANYYDADKAAVEAAVKAAKDVIDPLTGVAADLTTISNAMGTFDNEFAKYKTKADIDKAVADAKAAAIKKLNENADAFKGDETKGEIKRLNDIIANVNSTPAEITEAKTLLTRLNANISAVINLRTNEINAVTVDKSADLQTAVETTIPGKIGTDFNDNNAFYATVSGLGGVSYLKDYAATKAAAFKTELAADGTIKYYAATVDEALKTVTDKVASLEITTVKGVDDAFNTALNGKTKSELDAALAQTRKDKKAAVDTLLNGRTFTGERKDKVDTLVKDAKDAIDAAADETAMNKILEDVTAKIAAVLDDTQIVGLKGKVDTEYAATYKSLIDGYVDSLIARNGAEKYDATTQKTGIEAKVKEYYYDLVLAKEDKDLTDAAVKSIMAQNYSGAVAVAEKNLVAKDTLAAAEKAINDQLDALDYTVNAETTPKILAAYDAYKNYKELNGSSDAKVNKSKLDYLVGQVVAAERKVIADKITAITNKTAFTLDDIAALEELKKEAEAFNAKYAEYPGFVKITDPTADPTTITKIEAARYQDAIAKINAIPEKVTYADKATVEAARAAYDALTTAQKAALNPAFLAKLIAAETKLEDAQIKAVESFKIKTTTKRYTGSKMRVNWTVVSGDESAIDGYRVYYSTKKSNSGYKYLTKTTKKYINHTSIKKNVKKGTRVYYRVRAYVEIDGQRYFSDYSTVGNRIWK
ncbi:fibronectin type III domain-containing protein [Anaerovoracaceae bacterium 42-11]